MSRNMSTVELGQQVMLVAALRILRKDPYSPEVQEEASNAADTAGKNFTRDRSKGRVQLEKELAEYLNRDLIYEALEVISKADNGDANALEMMVSLDESSDLKTVVSSKKIETIIDEMQIAAMRAFQMYGNRAHRKAREAALEVAEKLANGSEDVLNTLQKKILDVLQVARQDHQTAVKTRDALRS